MQRTNSYSKILPQTRRCSLRRDGEQKAVSRRRRGGGSKRRLHVGGGGHGCSLATKSRVGTRRRRGGVAALGDTAKRARSAPCFIICCRNLTITFDAGRTSTWRLPRFSALKMLRRQSLRTLTRTISAAQRELIASSSDLVRCSSRVGAVKGQKHGGVPVGRRRPWSHCIPVAAGARRSARRQRRGHRAVDELPAQPALPAARVRTSR